MNTPKSVLLVEDDKDDQEFFIMAIDQIHNAILFGVANNGQEALDKLMYSITLPDLIFSDINMPMMNGIQYLSEIVKNPRTQNIPVVMLTTDTSKRELVHQLGAKAFIEKPSDSTTLRNILERVINQDFVSGNYITNQTYLTELSA